MGGVNKVAPLSVEGEPPPETVDLHIPAEGRPEVDEKGPLIYHDGADPEKSERWVSRTWCRRLWCGAGSWKRWTGCCCVLFLLPLIVLLALYLPIIFHLSWAPYVCPDPEGNLAGARGTDSAARGSRSGYVLVEDSSGETFLDQWEFFTRDDPTRGFVNYVGREEAHSKNLTYYNSAHETWTLKADASTVVDPSARGRDSVRIEGKRNYTYGLFIIEVDHIPSGCATWPAWWMYADPWPHLGEVDVIEHVNSAGDNRFVGHTELSCNQGTVPHDSFLGSWTPSLPALHIPAVQCSIHHTGPGCSTSLPQGTFGPPFNDAGGGAYALEWDETGMRTFFWSNACGGVPSDVASGAPDPSGWGQPMGNWVFGSECPKERFQQMHMVVNLALCGEWAGGVLSWARCSLRRGMSCDKFVRDNPEEFADAYWTIRSIRVYQRQL